MWASAWVDCGKLPGAAERGSVGASCASPHTTPGPTTRLASCAVAPLLFPKDTYHMREHSTLGMKPLDRFGLDLKRIRHLHHCDFNEELFYLETTRKVRKDNTLHFQNTRYEAPRDLRGKTISIRYSRFNDGPERPPIAYYEDERLGTLDPVDFVANDRWAHIDDDNF